MQSKRKSCECHTRYVACYKLYFNNTYELSWFTLMQCKYCKQYCQQLSRKDRNVIILFHLSLRDYEWNINRNNFFLIFFSWCLIWNFAQATIHFTCFITGHIRGSTELFWIVFCKFNWNDHFRKWSLRYISTKSTWGNFYIIEVYLINSH